MLKYDEAEFVAYANEKNLKNNFTRFPRVHQEQSLEACELPFLADKSELLSLLKKHQQRLAEELKVIEAKNGPGLADFDQTKTEIKLKELSKQLQRLKALSLPSMLPTFIAELLNNDNLIMKRSRVKGVGYSNTHQAILSYVSQHQLAAVDPEVLQNAKPSLGSTKP